MARREAAARHQQVPAVEGERCESATHVGVDDTRVEHAAKACRFAQEVEVGPARHLVQRTEGHLSATIEQQQVCRQAHDVLEVVRDEHERCAGLALQHVDFVLQSTPHAAVDGGERLVEQQHGRVARKGTGDRDALALAARQLVRILRRVLLEMHAREQRTRAHVALMPRPMAHRGGHVPDGRQVRKERVILKHEARGALVWRYVNPRVRVAPHGAANTHLPMRRLMEPGDRPKDRRLAASRRAEDREHVAGLARERNVEGNGVGLPQLDLERRFTHVPLPRASTAVS